MDIRLLPSSLALHALGARCAFCHPGAARMRLVTFKRGCPRRPLCGAQVAKNGVVRSLDGFRKFPDTNGSVLGKKIQVSSG